MNLRDGKILVIDDLSDWRDMIGGLLHDAGYDVQTASNADDAMRLLRLEPYHVAVVDLRLDERDENNQEGLKLAERMKEYLPELAILILTGYADIPAVKYALQPRENGLRVAFDFLEKHEIPKLLPSIEKAFINAARVNPQLEIDFVSDFNLATLRKNIRNLRSLTITSADLEVTDLLKRIFHSAERISISPMNNGHSSGAVVLVTPTMRGIAQTDVVVKFNQREKAETESRNYDKYVENYVGGARRTQRLDFRSTARLGGIAYSFVGAETTDFELFNQTYQLRDIDTIKKTLDNLFRETCHTWYTKTRVLNNAPQSLSAGYKGWLRLDANNLVATMIELVRQNNIAQLAFEDPRFASQSKLYLKDRGVTLDNPQRLSQSAMAYHGFYCFTHGDLHEGNILVDNYNQTWLIDFYQTGLSHPVRDFAMLESAIKFSLQASTFSISILYDWERGLAHAESLSHKPSFDPPLKLDDELIKATEIVHHLRLLLSQILPEMTIRDYLISLYFHALKGMTLTNKLSERQRVLALISASLLTEQLKNNNTVS